MRARLSGGVKSAAKGSSTIGVFDAAPTVNMIASNVIRLLVIATPMLNEPDTVIRERMSGLRRTRSSRGDIRKTPAAYLCWVTSLSICNYFTYIPSLNQSRDPRDTELATLCSRASNLNELVDLAVCHTKSFSLLNCTTPISLSHRSIRYRLTQQRLAIVVIGDS